MASPDRGIRARTRLLRAAVAAAIAGPLAVALYLLAAIALAHVPVNRHFASTPPADGGIPVVVRSNGYHAEIAVPARGPFDWTGELPLPTAAGRAPAHGWVAFGWGDLEVYANTPTLADLRPGPAFVALAGLGRGALHVQPLAVPDLPPGYGHSARIGLAPEQYRRLVQELRDALARDADGRPVRLDAAGLGPDAHFFAARERYTALRTCNEWVRRRLAAAGVRMPAWAPFDRALFTQLDAAGAAGR